MFSKRMFFLLLVMLVAFSLAVPVMAQDAEPEVVIDGLVNPRNLSFDSEGNLYIATAGNGGTLLTANDAEFGASGQVIMVTPDGDSHIAVRGLMSFRMGGSRGAQDVLVTDESMWILLGETQDLSIPFDNALVELDKETGRVKTFVDLLTIELEQDPDGNPNGEMNPVDFDVAPDGTVVIAAAGCNCLVTWTPDAGVQVAAAWSHADDNPVPTSVDVDAEGNIYVGFLSGFPFPVDGARIEKWSGGELVETFEGLNAVTGLLVTDDGTIYAVETGVNQDGPGGRLVTVTADGVTPIVALDRPYGIVQGPDGDLYVTIGSRGGSGGAVVRIGM